MSNPTPFITKFWILVLIIIACNKNATPTPELTTVKSVTAIIGLDVDNQADASDIRVSFTAPKILTHIAKFRIALSKAGDIGVDQILNLPPTSFVSLDVNADHTRFPLPVNFTDGDGDAISENIKYTIFVLSESDDEKIEHALAKSNSTLILKQTNLVKTLVSSVNGGSGGIELDQDGNIYMGDFGKTLGGQPTGDKVYKISPAGQVSTYMTNLVGASGNAFDSQDNFYQSNIQGGFITKKSPDGAEEKFSNSLLNAPVGIAVDPDDNLYIANYGSNNILRMTPDGTFSVYVSGSLLNGPNGIAIDSLGNFFVANFNNGAVIKVDTNQNLTLVASLPGNNNGHLIVYKEFVYVIARSDHRIYRIGPDHVPHVLAGSGVRGHEDGPPLIASMSLPNDLAITPDGKRIYFNDVVPLNGSDIKPCMIRYIDLIE